MSGKNLVFLPTLTLIFFFAVKRSCFARQQPFFVCPEHAGKRSPEGQNLKPSQKLYFSP